MTGDLETAAADSLPHLLGGAAKHAPTPGATCANCGATLQGHYCHVCGQTADTHQRSIGHLIWEVIEGLFHLDGRLLRTIPALFVRPGRLARDYMEGRITRHVPPFRTFLVALLLFIFAAEHVTHEMTLANERAHAAQAAKLATPQGRAAEAARLRGEAAETLKAALADAAGERAEDLKDADSKPQKVEATYARQVKVAQAQYARDLARADQLAQGVVRETIDLGPDVKPSGAGSKAKVGWFREGLKKAIANPDYYWTVLFTWGHRAAVLLLPIVGLSLALVYRRRREIFIYDHLLVAMNILSFAFLTNALGLILPFAWMPWWFGFLALWTPVNLFQTLRDGYGSSILGATLKTLIVWAITVFAFSALLSGLMLLAIAEL